MSEATRKLLEESRKRRTYRSFLEEPVDIESIKDCIATAGTAPSGANLQPWHYTVVVDPDMKAKIREKAEEIERDFYANKISDKWREDLDIFKVNTSKPFLTQAPCLIVLFAQPFRYENGEKVSNYYVQESCGLANGLLLNAIRNAGYVSLTYTPSPTGFLTELLGRPDNERAIMVLAVGKPDPDFDLPVLTKKPLDEIMDII